MVHATQILGESSSMAALRAQIRHLASFDAPRNPHVPTVLLLGETGTGKGLVARAIHESGPRRTASLVDVNCAAIPENMLEAELFGFEAGAFTDARRAKPGLFEAASGGTLFLDEVDALSLPLQSKLLKAIEEKSVRRLGALGAKRVDVKLIAATQGDLRAMVASGSFRPDLYHRLAVVVLEIPPLRRRGDDAVSLAEHFLASFSTSYGLERRRLAPSARQWLSRHPWSGNVRELLHLMERVTLMGPRGELDAATLESFATPLEQQAPPADPVGLVEVSPGMRAGGPPLAADDDPARIRAALLRAGGNVAGAARLLGLGRNALRYRMRRYGIARPEPAAIRTPTAPSRFDVEPDSAAPATPALPTWEHKTVAVLAVDLAFPDADAAGAEPWTAAARWQQEIEEKVRGFGGVFVRRSLSRLVALFGIPRTLEQATPRAVHAAVSIQRLRGPRASAGRIAIHVGSVRVDTAASDPTASVLPVGDVLSLPERLLGHTGAGEVLMSAAATRRARRSVGFVRRELRLGPLDADRVEAFCVVAPPPADATAATGDHLQARFVGRGGELGFLEEAFAAAEGARGQLVFVVGEAGLGKSRLIAEFRARIARRDHLWIEGRCAAYGSASPFLPILDGLRRFLGVDDRDDEASIGDKLSRAIAAFGGELDWTVPFVRQLLSLRQTDETVASLDSASRRSELFRALRAIVLRAADLRPLVLVVEDLHWIDPASEEFLTFLSEGVPAARLLMVCSYRPGYRHPFGDRGYHARLALRPLSDAEMATVARSLVEAEELPVEVCRLVACKAEGNPFFVEEVTRSLLEDGSLGRRGGRMVLIRAVDDVAVPDTIEEVLLARIDRLAGGARRAIQVASVIGREFASRLLERIGGVGGELHAHLAELRTLELIHEKALHPELAYTFKHALTREVAYASVAPERRRKLHRAIGEAIEDLYRDRLGEHFEALAHHFTQAGVWDKALAYHERAAEKASESYANPLVIEHCEAALAIAGEHPESTSPEVVRRLWRQLGLTAFYVSRFALSARAFEAAARVADPPEERASFLGLSALAHLWAHQYAECVRTTEETRTLAMQHGACGPEALALSLTGHYRSLLEEDFDSADTLCRRAHELAKSSGDELAIGLTGFPEMLHREWSGEYEDAVAVAERIIEAGRRTGLANLVVWPNWFIGKARCCLGQYGAAIAQMEEAYAVCDRIGDIAWKGRLLNTLGWAYAEIGSIEKARECNQQALVLAHRLEDVEITANARVNLARNRLELGDVSRALAALEPIEEALGRTGDPWMRWRYRMHAQDVRAEIELRRGEVDRALRVAGEEIADARRHRAPKIEARGLVVRGRALIEAERFDDARVSLDAALEVAERISHPRVAWQAHGALADLARRLGEPMLRERHSRRREALLRRALDSLSDAGLRGRLRAISAGPVK